MYFIKTLVRRTDYSRLKLPSVFVCRKYTNKFLRSNLGKTHVTLVFRTLMNQNVTGVS